MSAHLYVKKYLVPVNEYLRRPSAVLPVLLIFLTRPDDDFAHLCLSLFSSSKSTFFSFFALCRPPYRVTRLNYTRQTSTHQCRSLTCGRDSNWISVDYECNRGRHIYCLFIKTEGYKCHAEARRPTLWLMHKISKKLIWLVDTWYMEQVTHRRTKCKTC